MKIKFLTALKRRRISWSPILLFLGVLIPNILIFKNRIWLVSVFYKYESLWRVDRKLTCSNHLKSHNSFHRHSTKDIHCDIKMLKIMTLL